MELKGIHHLTAISSRIPDNHDFYVNVLGMRLVKRSVNQDDVSAYHLFYADAIGTPGTDLTFFDWKVPPERRGTRSIARTSLRVRDSTALEWWAGHLTRSGVAVSAVRERDDRRTLDFEDPEGQRLSLVEDGGRGDPPVVWDGSTVPAEFQLRGLGPVLMSVPELGPTDLVLREVLGMRAIRLYSQSESAGLPVHVYEMGRASGPHAELHVVEEPNARVVSPGAGGVHHVAFRIADEMYEAWARHLNELGVRNSGPVDRYYFRSLYFREPNGILIELATDGPGFAVDEEIEKLGEHLALPPFLEPHRERIVAGLVPLA